MGNGALPTGPKLPRPSSTLPDDLNFLQPHKSGDELFSSSSGEPLTVPKYFLTFDRWTGVPIPNTYNGKPVIDWRGEPVFAELAVLRLFQSHGWNGVWVDSYQRKFRVGLPDVVHPIQMQAQQMSVLASIKACVGKSGGCWDVFAWKDDSIAFAELKRRGKDKIRMSQVRWLEQAQKCGINGLRFLLIEWDICGS